MLFYNSRLEEKQRFTYDYLFSKVIDELGSALCSRKQHDFVTKISALELMLKQQVPLIAISLDDFVQLNSAIKVFHAD